MGRVNTYIFAGPTLFGLPENDRTIEGITWMPPVARGDLPLLQTENVGPSVVVIVDGFFHQRLSVGHKEILNLLKSDWEVWGLSSMGAIRAVELRDFGMRGYGKVFQAYASNPHLRDDEVALLHAPLFPYLPLSEPLFHIRCFLDELCSKNYLTIDESRLILDELSNVWFGERSIELLTTLLIRYCGLRRVSKIESLLEDFSLYRQKQSDLRDFLGEIPCRKYA